MARETELKKISMKTYDGGIFEVEEAIAMEFQTVKSFIDDDVNNSFSVVPLPNVCSADLLKIIEYCKHQVEFRAKEKRFLGDAAPSTAAGGKSSCRKSKEAEAYDADFVKPLSNDELKELILAANYLNVKDLLELLNQTVADRIQNKSVEYVRNFFGIESDYTPEEEAQIRRENAWAFEGVDED